MSGTQTFPMEISQDKDCQDCKNFISYKSLSFFGKLRRKVDQTKSMMNITGNLDKNYGLRKNIESAFKFWTIWAYNGKNIVKQCQEIECTGDYHAIIIANYANMGFYKNLSTYAGGFDLLIKFFQKKSIPFKVISCHDCECFETAIKASHAKKLWIFGHGDRHGISFGDEIYFPYCRLENGPKKDFIAQLHCSNGEGKALWEYLSISGNPGIFTGDYRHVLQNRENIKVWISRN
jgi:hypothetical protein